MTAFPWVSSQGGTSQIQQLPQSACTFKNSSIVSGPLPRSFPNKLILIVIVPRFNCMVPNNNRMWNRGCSAYPLFGNQLLVLKKEVGGTYVYSWLPILSNYLCRFNSDCYLFYPWAASGDWPGRGVHPRLGTQLRHLGQHMTKIAVPRRFVLQFWHQSTYLQSSRLLLCLEKVRIPVPFVVFHPNPLGLTGNIISRPSMGLNSEGNNFLLLVPDWHNQFQTCLLARSPLHIIVIAAFTPLCLTWFVSWPLA